MWQIKKIFAQFLVDCYQGVPYSGKQSYSDIALILHNISVRSELLKHDCHENQKQRETESC